VILADYFMGFDYERRQVSSGVVPFFRSCARITASGSCEDPGELSPKLSQSAYTVGMGVTFDQDLRLTIEYHLTAYDRLYEAFHYSPSEENRIKSQEIFNARLSYGW
jgi:hypothetical protein